MSRPATYFVLPPESGRTHARYALLADDGRTVIGTQHSRPDGAEVDRPADVRWQPRPFIGGDAPRPPPLPARFHNVGPEAHARARRNAARRQQGKRRSPKE